MMERISQSLAGRAAIARLLPLSIKKLKDNRTPLNLVLYTYKSKKYEIFYFKKVAMFLTQNKSMVLHFSLEFQQIGRTVPITPSQVLEFHDELFP